MEEPIFLYNQIIHCLVWIKVYNNKRKHGVLPVKIGMGDGRVKGKGVPFNHGIVSGFCMKNQFALNDINIFLCFF